MESAKNDHNYYAVMAQSLPVDMVEIKMEEVDLDEGYDCEYSGYNYNSEQGDEAPNMPHEPSVTVEVVCEPICIPENLQIKTEKVDLDTEDGDEPSADDSKREESADIGVVQRRVSQRIRRKAKSSSHVCNECGKCYKYESCLMKHQQYHVTGISHETDKIPSQSIHCSEFGKQLKYPCDLKRHKRTHALANLKRAMALTCEETEDSPKPEKPTKPAKPRKKRKPNSSGNFVCDICSASFNKRKYLRYHQTIHTGKPKNSKRFYCEVCNYSLSKRKNLLRHMKNHPGYVPSITTTRVRSDSTRGEYRCNFCDKWFIYEIFLLKHMKKHHAHATSIHPDLSLFPCPDCGKTFSFPSNLKRHARIHTDEKNFHCDLCTMSFSTKTYLTRHIARHMRTLGLSRAAKRFLCTECGKSFGSNHDLRRHARSVHWGIRSTRHMRTLGLSRAAKRFLCTECGKSFGSNHDLRRHVRSVHWDIRSFLCIECGAAFKQQGHLRRHARSVHWGIRSFLCIECGAAFKEQGHLGRHMKRHLTVGLEFKCPQCPKYFVCKKALSVHSGTHAIEVRDVEGEVSTYVLIKGQRDEVLERCASSERKLANSDA